MNIQTIPIFIPGLKLSEKFYWEAVRPILDKHFPDLPHSATLLGPGSEVLGFDDVQSTDHHWGPRLMLFLSEPDELAVRSELHAQLSHHLPYQFHGYSTHYSQPNPDDSNVQHMRPISQGPVNHRVEILTTRQFLADYLAIDVDHALAAVDWLTLPEQKLRSLISGAIYHDDLDLSSMQKRFAYYPFDVWLYLLASGWERIGQEEHLMGRAGQAGDEIGSALIGARLVRDIMRLCFLMERIYAPYPKWFGSAFKQLKCAAAFIPYLQKSLQAKGWQQRERNLAIAYELLAEMHNALNVTSPLPTKPRDFWGRPFRVIALHGFSGTILTHITDPKIRHLVAFPPIGSLDLFSDNTDLISSPQWRTTLCKLYSDGQIQ